MMKRTLLMYVLVAAAAACTAEKDFVSFVDTSIGTGGHGHVFYGASVPFGAVQLGPTSIPESWDWCSGYHSSDSSLVGFSHTHLSGTGIGDLFDVTVLPVNTAELEYTREGIAAFVDRSTEKCTPGYYAASVPRYGFSAELTATARVGLHHYRWVEAGQNNAVIVNLRDGGCWDKVTDAALQTEEGNVSLRGHRFSSGWASDQKTFFAAEFSTPFESVEEVGHGCYRFNFPQTDEIFLKVAISPESSEAAASNMYSELPGWDFNAVRRQAEADWNAQLGKVEIETSDENARRIFYTSLYHTMMEPSVYSDCGKPRRYTTFSLWDTYRAQMPLMTILHPDMMDDIINTFLEIYDRQGDLPVWHLMGCETDCMVGNPGISVTADAILKGFDGFDADKAYEAMIATALTPDRGQDLRMKYGYIPSDLFGESVAHDMEYAIADWALAQVARQRGDESNYRHFLERSRSYSRHFDAESGFMRGLDSKGRFSEPFNPFYASHRANDYCEGNAWQYIWLVPHDFKGLCDCFSRYSHFTPDSRFVDRRRLGRDAALQRLDSLFAVSSKLEGEDASPDISGMIGQYAHGNEPSHHVLYFYTMAGQPWKTADLVRKVCTELYSATPDGLCGNEDAGQMSAWYILSSIGFYQVEPAGGRFWFGSPLFDKVSIKLPEGRSFTLTAPGNSAENRYIQSVFLNGKPYTKPYLEYKDIMAGGEVVLNMGSEPKLWYCPDEPEEYVSQRPAPSERHFTSEAVEKEIAGVTSLLTNRRLAWMFGNCFPNTLDTTVDFTEDDGAGNPDTFVYTGDIHAMWLRDSGAQVWPYLRYADTDEHLRRMLEGTIRRQFKCICIDPYANAFNVGPTGSEWETDNTVMNPNDHERKWEVDSHCYPIRLAYGYWKKTGDASVFDANWLEAIRNILRVLKEQQRRDGRGSYYFTRECDRQYDMKCNYGWGNPVKPVGLIVSSFRPSDDATVLDFLVPSNFFAVSSLRKAAEILESVNGEIRLAEECRSLADEVETALRKYAVYSHPEFGDIYAYEVDGFGNRLLMDDANVPSLLAMAYLGDVAPDDPIYRNTRRFVLSASNPYRFKGPAGAGIGGPHIGYDYIWPMSIMMRAFTSEDDNEIRDCIISLMNTDAGTGFMHESFHTDDPAHFTRVWFAWQNTLFGELILKLLDDGKLELLNSII